MKTVVLVGHSPFIPRLQPRVGELLIVEQNPGPKEYLAAAADEIVPGGDGIGTATAQVRAERDGGGNGRVYHITFTATDSFGNSCSGTIQVTVPKSRGRNGAAVDDGPLFDATLPE